MSLDDTFWRVIVITDRLQVSEFAVKFHIEKVAANGDMTGTYNSEKMKDGTLKNKKITFTTDPSGHEYSGDVVGELFVLGRKKGKAKGDGDDGTWTAEKTGGSGDDDEKKKNAAAVPRARKAAKKR